MSAQNVLLLTGPDGSNPLGFLTALGLLRTLSQDKDLAPVSLRWVAVEGWKPEISCGSVMTPTQLVERVQARLSGTADRPEFTRLGKNLTASRDEFHRFVKEVGESAALGETTSADFGAAFGSDALANDEGRMIDTAWRTMAGAGHQHFLETMRNLIQKTEARHIEKTLFSPWRYDDPMATLSLRLDPLDDKRYALLARDPSGDPSRQSAGSVQGANRLAIEALPLFPTTAIGKQLHTTGFRGQRASDTYCTWPVWTCPANLDVVRSLLSLRDLAILGWPITPEASPTEQRAAARRERQARMRLQGLGVAEVFRSQRLTIGKVRNFTPARSV